MGYRSDRTKDQAATRRASRERVITLEEERRYLAAAGEQMAEIATVLIDTGCDRKRIPGCVGRI
jgi:hypothetical protein